MSEKIWIGGIYLKEEGGYQIILKSLTHYKKMIIPLADIITPNKYEAKTFCIIIFKSVFIFFIT